MTRLCSRVIIALLALSIHFAGCAELISSNTDHSYYQVPLAREAEDSPEQTAFLSAVDVYLAVLNRCSDRGLQSSNYQYRKLANLRLAYRDKQDELYSAFHRSFVNFVTDLSQGRINPTDLGEGWERAAKIEPTNYDEVFHRFLRTPTDTFFATLGPQDERYKKLIAALEEYRHIEANGGWSAITKAVLDEALAERLRISGDLPPAVSESSIDREDLRKAVIRFQARHHLRPDGVIGKATTAALNVSVQTRIRQIELNLERWRWLPHKLEARFVELNIPGYTFTIYDESKPRREMRAIVGKVNQPTPVLRGEITATELNPDWDVPMSIARREILPILKHDPEYLTRHHMIVLSADGKIISSSIDWKKFSENDFPFRLRQIPGPWNAVGPIKFVFASRYGVFVHGTPAKELFGETCRGLSHGCIRIEDPVATAEFMLAGTEWTHERIEHVLASGKSQTIRLLEVVPLYLNYWTAWVDETGIVNFSDDIYGGDRALDQALKLRHHLTASPLGRPTTNVNVHKGRMVRSGTIHASSADEFLKKRFLFQQPHETVQ